MNGIINYTASPYRHTRPTPDEPDKQFRDKRVETGSFKPSYLSVGDDLSDTGSYTNGSHEDVLWSFEQQVKTMSKYGVVANSVEFEELERSLDEELKKYKEQEKDDTLKTINTLNTSEMGHNGSESDSPPPSPDDVLLNDHYHRSTDIDKLYKGLYRDHVIVPPDLPHRAPSDLDYYPTKGTKPPKVYPKSPKPGLKSYGGTNGQRSRHGSSSCLRSQHGSSSGLGSLSGSQSHINVEQSGFMPRCTSSGSDGRYGTRTATPPVLRKELNHRHLIDCRDSQGERKQLFGSNMSAFVDKRLLAVSPPLHPSTRGYASSMPLLDSENLEPNKGSGLIDCNKMIMDKRTISQISDIGSRTTNVSRHSINNNRHSDNVSRHSVSHRKHALKSRQSSDDQSAGSSTHSEPELQDIINILTTSTNLVLVNTAAGALQHIAYRHDEMKTKIREAGAIPILVHMLSLDDLVCISSLGALRNLSFGRNNHLNRIAIQDAHGIALLVQLLDTTESYEIQELVTGVFWNLSSSESLKLAILKQALEPLVKNIIVPQSGWKEGQRLLSYDQLYSHNGNISWTTVFRNATGCLKNLSSAGLDGRDMMRTCTGLTDSLLWTVRAAQGKNDVDNKAVENSVCILRNLSYRLEAEISPETKYGQNEDWRSRGLGGGQFRRKTHPDEESRKKKKKNKVPTATPLPEHTSGVGLLWQSSVVRVYLDLLLECSNPETLEGAAGALQNLTACSWEPAQTIRETVRREKGLSVITSLLRHPNDLVVRATAFCLRNLALDIKNKDLLGKNAMHDMVKRLPGGDGADGITDMTISGIVCALLEVVADSADNSRNCRDNGGVSRLKEIAMSQDTYSRQCVLTSNKILAIFWEFKDIRKILKAEGWSISYYAKLQTLDRSDGLEYDETRNQFRISYTDPAGYNKPDISSPDPTFDSHAGAFDSHIIGRNHGTPDIMTSPIPEVTSPHHVTSPTFSPQLPRAATLGRSFEVPNHNNNTHRSYQDIPAIPPREHQTLPSRNHDVSSRNHDVSSRNHDVSSRNHDMSSGYVVADSWV